MKNTWNKRDWEQDTTQDNEWNHVGGCFAKHPFNKEKRAQCEQSYLTSPKAMESQADLILAQAAAQKASQNTGWTATQTAGVAVASLLAIGLMVFIIKKSSKK
jgi:hypothetical protein